MCLPIASYNASVGRVLSDRLRSLDTYSM